MSIFIQKGDEPLTLRQSTKRGMAVVAHELAMAGARKGDEELLRVLPTADLTPRLAAVIAALGHPSYQAYALQWEADNLTNTANNLFNFALVEYRAAQARLVQYRLADGRPEITEEQQEIDEFGMPVYDPATGDPVMVTVVVQSAIDPLPPTVERPVYDEVTGEQTGVETVDHPDVVRDDAERAAAQAVIDAAPADVAAWDTA